MEIVAKAVGGRRWAGLARESGPFVRRCGGDQGLRRATAGVAIRSERRGRWARLIGTCCVAPMRASPSAALSRARSRWASVERS